MLILTAVPDTLRGLTKETDKLMKATIKRLKIIFYGSIILAAIVVLLFETGLLPSGCWAVLSRLEFVVLTAMELLTLFIIPFSLRLFKFKKVHEQLVKPDERWHNLLHFGVSRMLMLAIPMLVCTILYYMFMSVALGYLAIILFLCMFFVYPSEDKCIAETTDDEN